MHVEIWSDIACPWCAIGQQRFGAALALFNQRDEVRVSWRSFELDPNAPHEREGDRTARLAAKYGVTREQADAAQAELTAVAAAEGLRFRFDLTRDGNMLDGHRLVHLAAAHGAAGAMKERLFAAHLGEGELLSDHATLARLAAEVGLPDDEVRELLAGDRYAADVREDERTAAALGITAVPFFVVDRRLGTAGAHPSELLLRMLDQAWASRPEEVSAETTTAPNSGP